MSTRGGSDGLRRSSAGERGKGLQEILVLIVIGLAIFYLPRVMGRRSAATKSESTPRPRLSSLTGRMRLAILVTLLWIAAAAALLRPWEGGWLPFAWIGLGPAVVLWGACWVRLGYRKHRH